MVTPEEYEREVARREAKLEDAARLRDDIERQVRERGYMVVTDAVLSLAFPSPWHEYVRVAGYATARQWLETWLMEHLLEAVYDPEEHSWEFRRLDAKERADIRMGLRGHIGHKWSGRRR